MLTHDRLAAVAFGLMIAALIIRGVIYLHEAGRNVESSLDILRRRPEYGPGSELSPPLPDTQRGDAA